MASGTRRRIWDSSISVIFGIAVIVQRHFEFTVGHIRGAVQGVA